MKPTAEILIGDVRERLRELPDKHFHCVVTSPPYWGLRDYGTGTWKGGNADCDHVVKVARQRMMANGRGELHASSNQSWGESDERMAARKECPKCGAQRVDRQIGSEATPDEYVAVMVDVFREVWRVLRDDGTLWLNLGDSYCSVTGVGRKPTTTAGRKVPTGWTTRSDPTRTPAGSGLKPKDLCGMPFRVALALQADGWYWRDCIIWHKPSPIPESVRDRCTKAHEYVFLLTKKPRYFYDAEAIAEPAIGGARGSRFDIGKTGVNGGGRAQTGERDDLTNRNARSVWTIASQ